MNDLLFVYGSLLSTGNEFAAYLNANSRLYGTAKFKGLLYDIGEYPGAILSPPNAYEITGQICQLNSPEKALEILDAYEGFGPKQLQPNLFIRELLTVETINGPVSCWLYLYNLPIDGLTLIPSGNYQQYLKSKA
jgi:gamma-glutamylcyclotransferase (GGCT)/AIG2-like uncharacterized protein YtfP